MGFIESIEICKQTDPGLKLEHNEDAVGSDPGAGVVALADGVGGHKGGEVASGITVAMLLKDLPGIQRYVTSQESSAEEAIQSLSQKIHGAVISCNKIIHQVSLVQPQYSGMATTVVAGVFFDNRLVYSQLGDSRLYRLRNGALEQLTTDHSLYQELKDQALAKGDTNAPEAPKNIITQALGIDMECNPTTGIIGTEVGDTFLFCSDGLTDMVPDELIASVLNMQLPDLEACADQLILQAKLNGGDDNISVILARIRRPFPHG